MKKTIYLKSVLLLCLLLVGAVSTQAQDYDYEWVKVTNLSDVQTGDNVVLVDETNKKALSHESDKFDTDNGYDVTISDGKITSTVPAYLQWTLTKGTNNTYSFGTSDGGSEFLCGDTQSTALQTALQLGDNNDNRTNSFFYDNYDSSGGRLYYRSAFNLSTSKSDYCCVNWNGTMFNAKWYDGDFPKITLYKRTVKNYVKWKRIDSENVNLEEDAVIVVVDLKSGRALSNDKADKDPDAVAVTLNDDKDRILGEVPEKVQWIYNRTQGKGATFKTNDDKYLYADTENKGLKVGEPTGDNQYFSYGCENDIFFSLWTNIGSDAYLLGVEESMFSNTWKLIKPESGEDIDLAFFKKIEDPQKIVTIELAEYYTIYSDVINYTDLNASITGAEFSEINWASSKPGVATAATVTDEETNRTYGKVTGYQRGSTVITASVIETDYHDKASAKSTVIVDEVQSTVPGSLQNPLTVAQAKELAEKGKLMNGNVQVLTLEEGVRYYIKGKVSKVNSGMMAMFGDMDFGEMMGGSGSGMNFEDSMDDMDFDMEDMEESGFDMSSMGFDMSSLGFDMSAMFGTSDKVTYYISDDGTKDGQMKVVNGCGTLKSSNGTMEFNPIPKLSPGDCVVVCGPLVYTEDTNMFSSMMGGNKDEQPKMSGKVDEMNYLAVYDPTLLIKKQNSEAPNEVYEIYVNKTLDGKTVYEIDDLFDRFNEVKIPETAKIEKATFKSSDEDIAKCEESEDKTTTIITGVNEGKAKITVKVKVVLQEPDDQANPKVEEKSYTMKRKFKLIVKPRGLDPAGYYDGEWKLTTKTEDLKEGTRLVLVGTRVKVDKETADETLTDYMMVENNAMMGGGKNGSKIEFEDSNKKTIPSSTVINKKGLEVVLEQAEDGTSWYLNVGTDENDTPLYLYASVKKESSNNQNQQSGGTGGTGGTGGFNMDEMMEMFNPSSGLIVGTKAETASDVAGVDSLKATITIADNIATIKFPAVPDDKNNTIMLSSSFDMEEMMGMFGGNNSGGGNSSSSSSFDMGSFDMFMASFNTKKSGDENAQEGKDPKCFMPRIYRFVPDPSYKTAIGSTEWKTIVSYKDVQVPENVEVYVVKSVTPDGKRYNAHLTEIKEKQLKGGKPYLLHSANGNYTMTLLTEEQSEELSAPEPNLLEVSTRKTIGDDQDNKSVYVLANMDYGVGFYRWNGGDLGAGRVYLPIGVSPENEGGSAKAYEFCNFLIETAIDNTEKPKSDVKQYYNLNGQRVTKPSQKGVYIVNGKAVIVK